MSTRSKIIFVIAEALSDSLTQLGVPPDERPEHGGESIAEVLAAISLRAYLGYLPPVEPEILNFATQHFGERTWDKIALKACGEMGEFAEAITKISEGRATYEDADEEAGDVLFVLSQYAAKRGTTLEALRATAFEKCKDRVAPIDTTGMLWSFGDFGDSERRLQQLPSNKLFGAFQAPETPMGENPNGEDDEHPLWCINDQITGLLEGEGADEDHKHVIWFLKSLGLPESTVKRMHHALIWGDTKTLPPEAGPWVADALEQREARFEKAHGNPYGEKAVCSTCQGYGGVPIEGGQSAPDGLPSFTDTETCPDCHAP